MTIDMKDDSIKSVAQLLALIKAAEALGVETVQRKNSKDAVYAWFNDLLLRICQTKSRSRRTNDNALVEGKNGAVIRKHFGYMHIPKQHALAISGYYRTFRNPFVNFHRFSAFPDEETDAKGKITKKYRTYLTPCQKLLSIPLVDECLKTGTTRESLEKEARRQSHLAAAQEIQKEKHKLFSSFSSRNML